MMRKLLFVISVILCVSSGSLVMYWDIPDGTRHNRAMQDILLLSQVDGIVDDVVDPWGRPYLRVVANSGALSASWFFSQGPDRKSKTLGNDPDDIAPWTEQREFLEDVRPVRGTLFVAFISGIAAVGLGASLATSRHNKKMRLEMLPSDTGRDSSL